MILPVPVFQEPADRTASATLRLVRAIERKDERAAERAIDAGANPNAYVVGLETMLMRAAATGSVGMVRLLVRRGVDVGGRGHLGFGVLDAAEGGPAKSQPEMVEALLALGARPTETTLWGFLDRPAVVKLLIAAKVPVDATALNRAIEDRQTESLRLMLAAHPPLDKKGIGGHPLHVAASWGNAEAARLLLAHGAKPNLRDERGDTAAQVAVETGHPEVAALLGVQVAPRPRLALPDLMRISKPFARGLVRPDDYAWRSDGGLVVLRPFVESPGVVVLGKGVLTVYGKDGRRLSERTDGPALFDARLSPDGQRAVWNEGGVVHDARIDGTDDFSRKTTEFPRALWAADSSGWVALGWNASSGENDRTYWRDGREEPLALDARDARIGNLSDEIAWPWVGSRDQVRAFAFPRDAAKERDAGRATIVETSLTPTAHPQTVGTFAAPHEGRIEEARFSPDGRRVAWIVSLPRDHRVGLWTSLADGTEVRCVGTMPDRSRPRYGVLHTHWQSWRLNTQPHHLRWTSRGGLSFVLGDTLRVVPNPEAVR